VTNLDATNPFPGLRPFTFEDSDWLFGRKRHIDQLRLKLKVNRFVAVVGRSGDGKSSLVSAGLRPRLAGEIDEAGRAVWFHEEMRPQGDPLTSLAKMVDALTVRANPALADFDATTRIQRNLAFLTRSSSGLSDLLRQIVGQNSNTSILLVIDQFEELFRFIRPKGDEGHDFDPDTPPRLDDATTFVNLLLDASNAADTNAHIVLTMRSEFLGDCTQLPGLVEAINDSQFLVPRLTRTERKSVIADAVAQAGGQIDTRLVQRLLNDAGEATDMLPVLQHTLMRLWYEASLRETPPKIVLDDYATVGEVRGALSQHADDVLANLSTQASAYAAKIAFQAMVDSDADGRRTRRVPPPKLSELIELNGGNEGAMLEALNAFREADVHILRPAMPTKLEPNTQIDISHEAVIRRWNILQEWIDEEVKDAKIWTSFLNQLDQGATILPPGSLGRGLRWFEEKGPTQSWAARYTQDNAATKFADVSALIKRSQKWATDQTKIETNAKRTKMALAAVAALSVGTGLFAFGQISSKQIAQQGEQRALQAQKNEEKARKLAEDLRVEAENAKAEALRQTELVERERDKLAEALEAIKRAEEDARAAQQIASDAQQETQRALSSERLLAIWAEVDQALDESPDPKVAAAVLLEVIGDPGEEVGASFEALAFKALTTSFWPESPELALPSMRKPLSWHGEFSPDGSVFVQPYDDGTVGIWDAETLEKKATVRGVNELVGRISFDPTGETFVIGSEDGAARIWQTQTGELLSTIEGHSDWINEVNFSPNGDRIVTASDDNNARIWSAQTGELIGTLGGHTSWVNSAEFSPDGEKIVTASSDETARIWNTRSFEVEAVLSGHTRIVDTASFAPDGRRIASVSRQDGTARVWDVDTGELLFAHGIENREVRSAVFNSNGSTILAAYGDGTESILDAEGGQLLVKFQGHHSFVTKSVFSPDGGSVLSASENGGLSLWDAQTGKEIQNFEGHGSGVAAVFDPSGSRVLSGSADGSARLWDTRTGEQLAIIINDNIYRSVEVLREEKDLLEVVNLDGRIETWEKTTLLKRWPRFLDDEPIDWIDTVETNNLSKGGKTERWSDGLWSAEIRSTRGGNTLIVEHPGLSSTELLIVDEGEVLDIKFHPFEPLMLLIADEVTVWRIPQPSELSLLRPTETSPIARLTRYSSSRGVDAFGELEITIDREDRGTIIDANFSPVGSEVAVLYESETSKSPSKSAVIWKLFHNRLELVDALLDAELPILTPEQRCTFHLETDTYCNELLP